MSKKENSVGLKQCCRKIVTWIATWIETWPERTEIRFIILFFMAWLGLAFGSYIFTCITHLFPLIDGLEKYLKPATVSIPVLTALWYFRTYDTRQKIYQDDLFKGLDNLASNNPVQVDVGVAMLIEISKKVPSFNENIKIAFIRRLKSIPGEYKHKDGDFLSYAQHIIRWLLLRKKENESISFNLHGLDLSYQEFIVGADRKKIIFKELLDYDSASDYDPLLKNLSLHGADISGISFTGDLRVTIGNDSTSIDFGVFDNDHEEMIEFLQMEETANLTVIRNPK